MEDKRNTLENRVFNYEREKRRFRLLKELLDDAKEDLWEAESVLPIWCDQFSHDILFADSGVYPDLQPMMGPEEYIELPF